MKLNDLYEKYARSGINGAPVITDAELKELSEKLEETAEFLSKQCPGELGVRMFNMGVQQMIDARKNKS